MELYARFFARDFQFSSNLPQKSHLERNYFLLPHHFTFTCSRNRSLTPHSFGELYVMRVKLFASVIAIAILGSVPGFTVTAQAYDSASTQGRIDIVRIKNVLKLTPEQQHYWPAVESALRNLARQQAHQFSEQSDGLVRRVSNQMYSFVMDSATVARVGAAARPLVKVLDDRQKQDAIALCHEMGLGQVLAALM